MTVIRKARCSDCSNPDHVLISVPGEKGLSPEVGGREGSCWTNTMTKPQTIWPFHKSKGWYTNRMRYTKGIFSSENTFLLFYWPFFFTKGDSITLQELQYMQLEKKSKPY